MKNIILTTSLLLMNTSMSFAFDFGCEKELLEVVSDSKTGSVYLNVVDMATGEKNIEKSTKIDGSGYYIKSIARSNFSTPTYYATTNNGDWVRIIYSNNTFKIDDTINNESLNIPKNAESLFIKRGFEFREKDQVTALIKNENNEFNLQTGNITNLKPNFLEKESKSYLNKTGGIVKVLDSFYTISTSDLNDRVYLVKLNNTGEELQKIDITNKLLGNNFGVFDSLHLNDSSENPRAIFATNTKDGYVYKIEGFKTNDPKVMFYTRRYVLTESQESDAATDCIEEGSDFNGDSHEFDYGSILKTESTNNFFYARSKVTENHYLGEVNTSETDIFDVVEDGVVMNSTFSNEGENEIKIKLGGEENAFVSAWIDFDQNGVFDSNEVVLDHVLLENKQSDFKINVKEGALSGETWMRFRSSSRDHFIMPYGTSGSGEVEDYKITIEEKKELSGEDFYPSADGYITIAFEDKWPLKGDYDFNDVVIKYKTSNVYEDDFLRGIKIKGEIQTYGAEFHNGFAMELKGRNSRGEEYLMIPASSIDENNIQLLINGIKFTTDDGIEILSDYGVGAPVIRVVEDLREHINSYRFKNKKCSIDAKEWEREKFYRSNPECNDTHSQNFTFSVFLPIKDKMVNMSDVPVEYKPFIYSSPERKRFNTEWDDILEVYNRGLEIHIKNESPTEFSLSDNLEGYGSDSSIFAVNETYVDNSGMPWALMMNHSYLSPESGLSILDAYQDFKAFAESSGTESVSWFENHLIQRNGVITKE